MGTVAETLEALCPYDELGSSHDREAWLSLRKTGIGASEAAVMMGESPWASAWQLWHEKRGLVDPKDLSDNEAVEWGLRLEGAIADAFGARTGRHVLSSGTLLRSREHPWALATLDAWTGDELGRTWPLEIKTAGAHHAERWEHGPPIEYLWQLQHQMLVTDAPRATISCLLGGQRLVWCDVERDETMIRRLIRTGAEFWRSVEDEDGRPPEADPMAPGMRATLEGVYRGESKGQRVELPRDLAEIDDALVEAKARRKALDAEIEALENSVRSALGHAETGVLLGQAIYTWRTEHRAAFTVAASSRRVLRRKEWRDSK